MQHDASIETAKIIAKDLIGKMIVDGISCKEIKEVLQEAYKEICNGECIDE